MIKMALIGAGRIGQIHGENMVHSPNVELVAITDTVDAAAEQLSKKLSVPVQSTENIFADYSIDAVLIASSTDTHADYIEQAAKNNKAVFCEKPIDLSIERVKAAYDIVESEKISVMIGFNRRFDPHFASLKARIDQGVAGEIELVSIISRDPSPPPAEYIARSGGLFRDMMIHDLDMARFLIGEEFTEIHALGSALIDPAIGAAGDVDTATVILKSAGGKICQISNSRRAAYGYDQRIEVHASKGLLQVGNVLETGVSFSGAKGILADPVQNFFLQRYEQAYKQEIEQFAAWIDKGENPSPNMFDGLQAQRLADAATEACLSGKTVRL
jgi:myo-inositol 2-dehydrogenase/D-chiro-inositol 1-dehydrogenase